MPSVIFSGSKVKTLKDTININGKCDIVSGSGDPTLAAVDALQGSLYQSTGTGLIYRKMDNGSSTNWEVVGSGSSGSKNYAKGNDSTFDTGMGSNWAVYDDGSATPADGQGGTTSATFARTTTTPLQGAGSGLFTPHSALGEGAAFTFTIDRADFARMFKVEFDYEINTYASYTDGDVQVWIISASDSGFTTNLEVTQPAGYKILKVAGQETHVATFQSHISNQYYKVCLHQATASTGYTLEIDNFKVGPQSVAYGAPVLDAISFTPTGSWITNATYTGQYWRVGKNAKVDIKVSLAGAPTAAAFYVNLPFSIDTSALLSTSGNVTPLGRVAIYDDSGNGHYFGSVTYRSATSVWVDRLQTDATGGTTQPSYHSTVTDINPITFAANDRVELHFEVPVLGWSSSVLMSDSAETRVCAARYKVSASSTNLPIASSSIEIIDFDSKDYDTHSMVTTGASWKVTAPMPGFYQVSVGLRLDNTNTYTQGNSINLYLYKNGSAVSRAAYVVPYTGTVSHPIRNFDTIYLNAGEYLDARIEQNSGNSQDVSSSSNLSFIAVDRLSGPAQIAASEKVHARYKGAQGGAIGAAAIVNFGTLDFDSHGAVTTGASWKFTAPKAATYLVSSCVLTSNAASSTNDFFNLDLYKNGVYQFSIGELYAASASAHRKRPMGTSTIKLLAGDYIDIRIATGAAGHSLDTGVGSNYVCIESLD